MIIWLTSYPKSGNTWLRSFIISILYQKKKEVDLKNLNKIRQYPLRSDFKYLTENLDNIHELSKYWIKSQKKINSENKLKILKTHHTLTNINGNYFTNFENTFGAIYIVRDPRNVVSSIHYHYSKKNIDDALKFILDDNKVIGFPSLKEVPDDNEIITPIASWRTHYNSWKLLKKNFLLIKYENLILNPYKEFTKIVLYLEKCLKIKINKEDIDWAIDKNSFENLKKIEQKKGFNEAAKDNQTGQSKIFFNLGPNNNWNKNLKPKIISIIEDKFNKEMKELGYL